MRLPATVSVESRYHFADEPNVSETVHRLRDQRETGVSLHAQEPILDQVPHLEAGHLAAVRLVHHVHDRA